jgi:TolB protein
MYSRSHRLALPALAWLLALGLTASCVGATAAEEKVCRRLIFQSEIEDTIGIYTASDDGSNLVRLTSAEFNAYEPVWSPAARRIAFSADASGSRQLYAMDIDGGNVAQLTFDAERAAASPRWSPDGSRIVFSYRGSDSVFLYIMNADGSGLRPLDTQTIYQRSPDWSPDALP